MSTSGSAHRLLDPTTAPALDVRHVSSTTRGLPDIRRCPMLRTLGMRACSAKSN